MRGDLTERINAFREEQRQEKLARHSAPSKVRERTIELPLAVRLRDEEGPPLPQMIAQRRAQLSIERTREHTEFQNADALADEYESGLRKMEASSYEEFADIIPKHKLIIKALRAFRSLTQAGGKL